ncbi:MAG: type II secretion system GspH family protein [bacterium]|nr:type II secretion system GspH family protein [bacterium]
MAGKTESRWIFEGMVPRQRRKRAGFTLLELIAGSVLMATLLVSLVLAISKQRSVLRLAEDRQTATLLADELLAQWVDAPQGIPLGGSGRLPSMNQCFWRTSVIAQQTLFGKAAAVVRLDIVRLRDRREQLLVRVETLWGVD